MPAEGKDGQDEDGPGLKRFIAGGTLLARFTASNMSNRNSGSNQVRL